MLTYGQVKMIDLLLMDALLHAKETAFMTYTTLLQLAFTFYHQCVNLYKVVGNENVQANKL